MEAAFAGRLAVMVADELVAVNYTHPHVDGHANTAGIVPAKPDIELQAANG